jgi:hypothetical protein
MTKSNASSQIGSDLTCPHCRKTYAVRAAYTKHIAECRPEFECPICQIGFEDSKALGRHLLTCSKEKAQSQGRCDFCNKRYPLDYLQRKHRCERMKRFHRRDEEIERLAYKVYTEFQKVNFNRPVDAMTFVKDRYYNDFIKFSKYIRDINSISDSEYIDYVIRKRLPVTTWWQDTTYEKFVTEVILKETPYRALERTLVMCSKWGIQYDDQWQNTFRNISTGLAVQWITSGRLSPWVIFNCESGRNLLGRLSDEQLALVGPRLSVGLWRGKFERHPEEINDIQQLLREEGL